MQGHGSPVRGRHSHPQRTVPLVGAVAWDRHRDDLKIILLGHPQAAADESRPIDTLRTPEPCQRQQQDPRVQHSRALPIRDEMRREQRSV